MGANAARHFRSSWNSGKRTVGALWVFAIVVMTDDHHAGVLFSAVNGARTILPPTLYAELYLLSSAIRIAMVPASISLSLLPPLVSGIGMILKPGSTSAAACIISLALSHSRSDLPAGGRV